MNPRDEANDDLLASLLVAYDEALDRDAPVPEAESVADDAELAARLQRAKACLELLDRVRRRDAVEATPHTALDTVAPQPSERATFPERIGRFEIVRELGRGGLGVVLLARDPQLRRHLAIKIPRADLVAGGELERRFLREAEAAARLSHPHLVTLHEVGRDGQLLYLVSEYCPGPSLAEWLRTHPAGFTSRAAARLVLGLAEAVHHAHSRGVLHRDIKPSNVLLVPPTPATSAAPGAGDGGIPAGGPIPYPLTPDPLACFAPKLTDFGMARLLESTDDRTRTGAILGTPAYMAPEQADGRTHEVDARADVYGLGAVLYELLTGMPPYQGASDVDTLRQLLMAEPAEPRTIRPGVPRDLQTICLKALQRAPERRYQTAQEMAVDLRRWLHGEAILARPPGRIEKCWRWARKRPATVSTVVLVCGIALLGALTNRLALENHALLGLKPVTISSDPEGAELAFVLLDETTDQPVADPARTIRGVAPFAGELAPGDYLVVAALDARRFHEVRRRVPKADEIPGPYDHNHWHRTENGTIQLAPVKIPDEAILEGMIFVQTSRQFDGAKPRSTAGIYTDPHRFSIGEHQALFQGELPRDKRSPPGPPNLPVAVDFDRALAIAEKVGKRLPTEAEYEAIHAHLAALRNPQDLDNFAIDPWAEWTTSRNPLLVPSGDAGIIAIAADYRIVRGGGPAFARLANRGASSPIGPDRMAVSRFAVMDKLGFRCVRSDRPRFIDLSQSSP